MNTIIVKSKILRFISELHSKQLQDEAQLSGALANLYFFIDTPSKSIKEKQAIIKRINELKGMTRFRLMSEQTDFIVVDNKFFSSEPTTDSS